MGRSTCGHDHPVMDEMKLQTSDLPAIRSFPICLDRPQKARTIHGIVRRAADEQARTGSGRPVRLPRRLGAFA